MVQNWSHKGLSTTSQILRPAGTSRHKTPRTSPLKSTPCKAANNAEQREPPARHCKAGKEQWKFGAEWRQALAQAMLCSMEKDPRLRLPARALWQEPKIMLHSSHGGADTFPAVSYGLGKHSAIPHQHRGTKLGALFTYLFIFATDHQAILSSALSPLGNQCYLVCRSN